MWESCPLIHSSFHQGPLVGEGGAFLRGLVGGPGVTWTPLIWALSFPGTAYVILQCPCLLVSDSPGYKHLYPGLGIYLWTEERLLSAGRLSCTPAPSVLGPSALVHS